MKIKYLILMLSMVGFFGCQHSEDHGLSELAKAKKEKYLQLVEKYGIEGYEVPASEEVWVNLDLEKLEATYKKMQETKVAFEEREKKLAEIRAMIDQADNPKEKAKELAREYPEYFVNEE